jgi:NitT/TauT family transport system permease protein
MMDTALMFAVFVVLTALGMLLYQLVGLCERWVCARRSHVKPFPTRPH